MTPARYPAGVIAFVLVCVALTVRASEQSQVLAGLKSLPEQQAISSLRQHLDRDPQWQRGRLELARLLYRQGSYAAARTEVKQAVASGRLPDTVKARVLVFYKQILDAEESGSEPVSASVTDAPEWSVQQQLRLGFGLQHRWQADLFDASQDETGTDRDLLQAERFFESQWLWRGERKRHSSDVGRWQWLGGLSGRQYSNAEGSDPAQALLMGSVRLPLHEQWQGTAFWRGQYRFDNRASTLGSGAQLFWQTPRQRLGGQLRLDYRDRMETGLDSTRRGISVQHQYRFSPLWQLNTRLEQQTYEYDDNRYDYRRRSWFVNTRHRVSPRGFWQVGLRQRVYDYRSSLPVDRDTRLTRMQGVRLEAGYQITPDWLCRASLQRQHERRPVATSTRNLFEISLTVSF